MKKVVSWIGSLSKKSDQQTTRNRHPNSDLSLSPLTTSSFNFKSTERTQLEGGRKEAWIQLIVVLSQPPPDGRCHLMRIPMDIMVAILLTLDPQDILAFGATCKQNMAIMNQKQIAKQMIADLDLRVLYTLVPNRDPLLLWRLARKARLFTWGDNGYGELGVGDRVSRRGPIKVPKLSNDSVKDICFRGNSAIVVTINNKVYWWGNAERRTKQDVPLWVDFGGRRIKKVVCGDGHNIVLVYKDLEIHELRNSQASEESSYNVYVFGANGINQISATREKWISKPTRILERMNIKDAQCGREFSIFLDVNGTAFALGKNHNGQLGTEDANSDLNVVSHRVNITKKIVQVACGDSHCLFLTEDGTVWGSGRNTSYQLGHLGSEFLATPKPIPKIPKGNVEKISCGYKHSIALVNSVAYVWGYNGDGQLGLGPEREWVSDPTPLEFIKEPVIDIIGAGLHTFCLTSSGQLWSCGFNKAYQCADPSGEAVMQIKPIPFEKCLGDSYVALRAAAGGYHAGALLLNLKELAAR